MQRIFIFQKMPICMHNISTLGNTALRWGSCTEKKKSLHLELKGKSLMVVPHQQTNSISFIYPFVPMWFGCQFEEWELAPANCFHSGPDPDKLWSCTSAINKRRPIHECLCSLLRFYDGVVLLVKNKLSLMCDVSLIDWGICCHAFEAKTLAIHLESLSRLINCG